MSSADVDDYVDRTLRLLGGNKLDLDEEIRRLDKLYANPGRGPQRVHFYRPRCETTADSPKETVNFSAES